jgi:hypothetical protein
VCSCSRASGIRLRHQEAKWRRADGTECSTCSQIYRLVYAVKGLSKKDMHKAVSATEESKADHVEMVDTMEDSEVDDQERRRKVRSKGEESVALSLGSGVRVDATTECLMDEEAGTFWPADVWRRVKGQDNAGGLVETQWHRATCYSFGAWHLWVVASAWCFRPPALLTTHTQAQLIRIVLKHNPNQFKYSGVPTCRVGFESSASISSLHSESSVHCISDLLSVLQPRTRPASCGS